MKIFISWSGEFSREVAEKLSLWIPSVIQSVDIFFSPDDIGKGENWDNKLSKELNECNFGIICLTPENVAAPWIHFEAGSLAKAVDSRLSSIMFGVNTSDIKGPLSRFQNTKFERADILRLMQNINAASDMPLKGEILANIFDAMWDRLNSEVSSIIKKYISVPTVKKVETGDSEAIQEILSIVRKMSNDMNPLSPDATVDLSKSNRSTRQTSPYISITMYSKDLMLSDYAKDIIIKNFPDSAVTRVIPTLMAGIPFSIKIPSSKAYILDDLKAIPDLGVLVNRDDCL